MSFSTLILLAWILKMLVLPSRSGKLNSTFLSNLPGLMSAGSRVSGLLVAINTLILPLGSNPSNWLISSNIKPGSSNSVNLVEEDQAGLLSPGHLEQLPHHPSPLPNILLYQL